MKKIILPILIFVFLVLGRDVSVASNQAEKQVGPVVLNKGNRLQINVGRSGWGWRGATFDLNKGDGLQIYLRRTGWGWRGAETITNSSVQLPAAPRTGWSWRRAPVTPLFVHSGWGWRGADILLGVGARRQINFIFSNCDNDDMRKVKKVVKFKAGSDLASKIY